MRKTAFMSVRLIGRRSCNPDIQRIADPATDRLGQWRRGRNHSGAGRVVAGQGTALVSELGQKRTGRRASYLRFGLGS